MYFRKYMYICGSLIDVEKGEEMVVVGLVNIHEHAVVWPNGVNRCSNLVLGLSWQSFVCACACVWRGTEEVHYLHFTRRLQRS